MQTGSITGSGLNHSRGALARRGLVLAGISLLALALPAVLRIASDWTLCADQRVAIERLHRALLIQLYGAEAATQLAVQVPALITLVSLLLWLCPLIALVVAHDQLWSASAGSWGRALSVVSAHAARGIAAAGSVLAAAVVPVWGAAVLEPGSYGVRLLPVLAPFVLLPAFVAFGALCGVLSRRRWRVLTGALLAGCAAVLLQLRQAGSLGELSWPPGVRLTALLAGGPREALLAALCALCWALGFLLLAAALLVRRSRREAGGGGPLRPPRAASTGPRPRWAARACALITLVSFSLSSTAGAYNNRTHQEIVNLAWQAMRAGVAPGMMQQVSWPSGTAPAGVQQRDCGLPPALLPPFDAPGDCALPASDPRNLCGRQVTAAEWRAYLQEIATARQLINEARSGIPAPGGASQCGGFNAQPSTPVGAFPRPISDAHLRPKDSRCATLRDPPQRGVYAEFRAPDDGTGNQGLVLGWHAQQRDNDHGETTIDMLPIIIPLGMFPYAVSIGQLLQLASTLAVLNLTVFFVQAVCVWNWLTGGGDCLSDSQRLAERLDPVDVLKGILPGVEHEGASEEADTIWHFINVRAGLSNWYDDRQGMFYDEAGPRGEPGGADQAIMLVADLMFMTLDASKSAGTSRYEITDDETPFANPSVDRADWIWQSEPFAHVQFSPIDNFALYGDMRVQQSVAAGQPDVSGTGWVLHAIGDVTSPMHVVGTTAWGHRPFEDAANHALEQLLYSCGPSSCAPDQDRYVLQLWQARRILEHGFKWRQFAKAHPDTRDLITSLAQETLGFVGEDSSLWCEPCSAGYHDRHNSGLEAAVISYYTEDEDAVGFSDPEGYYLNEPSRVCSMRSLLERAAGATLGYLISLPFAGSCRSLGAGCQAADNCCGDGTSCSATSSGAQCCRQAAAGCFGDAECCGAVCGADAQCCVGAGRAALGASCSASADCCSGFCAGGACAGGASWPCVRDAQCASDSCTAGVCDPGANGTPCSAARDCASGICNGGSCGTPNGGACTDMAECRSGVCSGGVCGAPNGASCGDPSSCRSNICSAGVCGSPNGGPCSSAGECIWGVCAGGVCGAPNGAPCSSPTDCLTGACSGGACGLPNGSGCSAAGECASGVCNAGVCGTDLGDPCSADAECLSGICAGGRCLEPGGAPCSSASECLADVCVEGTCGLPVGSACDTSSVCASRRCENGSCCGVVGDLCGAEAACCQGLDFVLRCSSGRCEGPPR